MSKDQSDADSQGDATVLAKALGDELRRAREARGWTRADVVARLPSGIGEQTLLTYEHGSRHCTFVRLVEVCNVLEVSPVDIAQHALQRAGIDLERLTLRIDLKAVIRDDTTALQPVRRWARNRVTDATDTEGVIHLTPESARDLAATIGCPRATLVTYLASFTPAAPRPMPRMDIGHSAQRS